MAGAGAVIFGAETLMLVSSIGLLGAGVSSFGYNYFVRKEHHEAKYLEKLQKDLERQNKKKLNDLKKNLSNEFQNGQKFAQQGNSQIEKAQDKINAFLEVLREKFRESSITHRRYVGSVENVYGSLLDNLKKVVAILRASDTINLSDIKSRIAEIQDSDTNADTKERETLQERKATLEKNLNVIDELLSQNEKALTTIDKVTSELSMIDTSTKDTTGTIEDGIEDLEDLTNNTKNYDNS